MVLTVCSVTRSASTGGTITGHGGCYRSHISVWVTLKTLDCSHHCCKGTKYTNDTEANVYFFHLTYFFKLCLKLQDTFWVVTMTMVDSPLGLVLLGDALSWCVGDYRTT